MGTGVDFKIDPVTRDFMVVDGDLVLTSTIEQEVYQRLSHKLNVWQGSWWADITFGTPYQQSILRKSSKSVVDAEFLRILRSDVQVVEVVEFESSLNRSTRLYDLRFVVKTIDGSSLNFIATSDPAGSEFLYPVAGSGFVQSTCDAVGDRIEYGNRLYQLMNFDLPPWPSEDFDYRFVNKEIFDDTMNEEWPEE